MSTPPTSPRLAVATKAAHAASEVLMRYWKDPALTTGNKEDNSIVTQADVQAEQVIVAHIREHFPEDVIVAEESTPRIPTDLSEAVWTIDPLDGTGNFTEHRADFGTMIGIASTSDVEAALVINPARQEEVVSVRGEGCWLNGTRVHVDDLPTVGAYLDQPLYIGWRPQGHPLAELPEEELIVQGANLTALHAAVEHTRFHRTTWSKASIGADLLTGAYTLYVGAGMTWDNTPWILHLEEAGFHVSDIYGQPLSWKNGFQVMVVCRPEYAEQLLAELAQYR